jgi:hypothetical protein
MASVSNDEGGTGADEATARDRMKAERLAFFILPPSSFIL